LGSNPAGTYISVFWECCLSSCRGLCDGPITCPEESYRVWCIWVWPRNVSKEALVHYKLLRRGAEKQSKWYTLHTCPTPRLIKIYPSWKQCSLKVMLFLTERELWLSTKYRPYPHLLK
jgi:hypothetical protein